MRLKNLMGEKKLDFNRPLLSVRRVSSSVPAPEAAIHSRTSDAVPELPPPPPVYKSDLKSGPVRNPGTVPFVWEQTPGRPKYESQAHRQVLNCTPVTPKLPPGRIVNVINHPESTPATNTSQVKNTLSHSTDVVSLEKLLNEEEREEAVGTRSCGSDTGDEVYVDARDTLSRTESFFMNCSISGVSGLDATNLRSSKALSRDKEAQTFMMDRFLPAAKAMASESPQYSARKQVKQAVLWKQPKDITNVVSAQNKRPLPCYKTKNALLFSQDNEEEESEDDDDVNVHGGPNKSSLAVCGLLPRLCLQNSFCPLNPVPGLSKQYHAPFASVRTRKANSSLAASCARTQNKRDSSAAAGKLTNVPLVTGLVEDKYEAKSEFNEITCKHNCQRYHGSSPKNVPPVNTEKCLLGIPEKCKESPTPSIDSYSKTVSNFRELLANESVEWGSANRSPIVEKTLYIDSVHMVQPQISSSSSSGLSDVTRHKLDDVDIPVQNGDILDIAFAESSLEESNHYCDVEKTMKPKRLESLNSCSLSAYGRSNNDVQVDVVDNSIQDKKALQDSETMKSPKVYPNMKSDLINNVDKRSINIQVPRLMQDSFALAITEVFDEGRTDLKREIHRKSSDEEISGNSYSLLPLPPPPPKAPSESWLKRTLPTVSSMNLSSKLSQGIYLNSKCQASKARPVDPKWETFVEPSNLQHGHLQFPEELLAPIPEA